MFTLRESSCKNSLRGNLNQHVCKSVVEYTHKRNTKILQQAILVDYSANRQKILLLYKTKFLVKWRRNEFLMLVTRIGSSTLFKASLQNAQLK